MYINFRCIVTNTLKALLRHRFALLATATLGTISALSPARATTFKQLEVDQNKFIALAVPRVGSTPQLIVLEQIDSDKACWKESGTKNPVTVEPLLLNFDFTGICGRSTDSNGYSIRMANQDLAVLYSLSIVRRDGQLVLIGTSNTRNAPAIVIGSTHGISSGVTKIVLLPGWRFTKRTFNGQTLDHVYLTNDKAAQSIQSEQH